MPSPRTDEMWEFRDYLKDKITDDTYNWYNFWENAKSSLSSDDLVSYCSAIIKIPSSDLSGTCLCQLAYICDDICDDKIERIFSENACSDLVLVGPSFDYAKPPCATPQDCSDVLNKIGSYQTLCGDTQIYQVIADCANGTPSPDTLPSATPSPIIQSTPSPSSSPSTPSTPSPVMVKSTPSPTQKIEDIPSTTPQTTETVVDTTWSTSSFQPSFFGEQTDEPTLAPTVGEVVRDSNGTTTERPNVGTPSPFDVTDLFDNTDTDGLYQYDNYDNFEETASPSAAPTAMVIEDSHPFANLLLVSLIILGFCVFVAWYAKKNQISSDGMERADDDNGYLWGLNKSSPSSSDQRMMNDGMPQKRGKLRHKKLSQFDDDALDQRMNIQMTMNNDDLLSITPDHIGRLQTRNQMMPKQMAPSVPHKKQKKTKRKGKGGAFSQLKDHDDPMGDDDDSMSSTDSEDGVDMMKMRDQYYASQTFSKKLADTLGDIHDTVKVTASAVKNKLTKKEQTVVVPMQIKKRKKKEKKSKKKQPFTMVEDNETTDGFDLSVDSSNSTQENEYREDSETEVRMNIHGRKIKQPMKLPTFDDDDDDEMAEISALSQSHSQSNEKKKKKRKKDKKDKKKKKKKKDKHKTMNTVNNTVNTQQIEIDKVIDDNVKIEVKNESHDITLTINNDDNMGFGTDELEDDNIELTKNIELTNDDVTMTMNDLQNELMKHTESTQITDNDIENEQIVSNDNNNNVDLSFMDDVVNDNNDENNNDLSNGNGVVGNGNASHQN